MTDNFRRAYTAFQRIDGVFRKNASTLWEFIFNDLVRGGPLLYNGYVFEVWVDWGRASSGKDAFKAHSPMHKGLNHHSSFILPPCLTSRHYTYHINQFGQLPDKMFNPPVSLPDDFIVVKTGKLITIETVRGILTQAERRQGYTTEEYFAVGDEVIYRQKGWVSRTGVIKLVTAQEIHIRDVNFGGSILTEILPPKDLNDIRKKP